VGEGVCGEVSGFEVLTGGERNRTWPKRKWEKRVIALVEGGS
jgi:hypothetical protein